MVGCVQIFWFAGSVPYSCNFKLPKNLLVCVRWIGCENYAGTKDVPLVILTITFSFKEVCSQIFIAFKLWCLILSLLTG